MGMVRDAGTEDAPAALALLPNNFDLLRLAAAAQVLIVHLWDQFFSTEPLFIHLLRQAPGVPVFFFISGFLISASWERNPDPSAFARNRLLRLAPAYLAVTLFTLACILAFAHLPLARDGGRLVLWLGAQLVLLCDWNPRFLRHYGDGVANGSLWTIPIEVAFYIATPILYWLMRRSGRAATVLGTAIVLSFAVDYLDHRILGNGLPFKLLSLTPLPWFGMFCCGIAARRNLTVLMPLLRGRVWLWAALCLVLMVLCLRWRIPPILMSGSRFVGLANFAVLAMLTLSAAYTRPWLATRLLRRNDISYGLYLVHLPVGNALLANGFVGLTGVLAAAGLSVALAILSWFAIERPALARRISALYPHAPLVTARTPPARLAP
ncbi:MAG: acyltransferase [Rhizomicrobium sp.]